MSIEYLFITDFANNGSIIIMASRIYALKTINFTNYSICADREVEERSRLLCIQFNCLRYEVFKWIFALAVVAKLFARLQFMIILCDLKALLVLLQEICGAFNCMDED